MRRTTPWDDQLSMQSLKTRGGHEFYFFFHSLSYCQSLSDVSLIKAYSLIPCAARYLCNADGSFFFFLAPKNIHCNRKPILDNS